MKAIQVAHILSVALLAIVPKMSVAQFEVVVSKSVNQYGGISFYYTQGVVLKPGFSINANQGSFFVKKFTQENQPGSPDQNFVRTENILVSGVTQDAQISSLPIASKSTAYEFVDGLGRKSQSLLVQAGLANKDMITPVEYDVSTGRMLREYLTFSKFNTIRGKFFENAIADQAAFFQTPPVGVAGDSRPFSENSFENSPLSRIYQKFGAGSVWKTDGKAQTSYTKINTAANEVLKWNDYSLGFPSLVSSNGGYFNTNTLIVEESINEDGQISKVYKNARSQVVLSRVGDGSNWFDTYTIYSPSGLVMFVIQPEGTSRLAAEYFATGADKQSFLDRWTFQFQYDDEGRVIAKRIPGSAAGANGWNAIVYDRWNRVVITQSPQQIPRNEYCFTKYDRFNRAILTGLYTTNAPLATLRSDALSSNTRFEVESNSSTGYTLTSSYPTSIAESSLIAVTYYDNYNFKAYTGWDSENNNYSFVNVTGYPTAADALASVKGQVTGAKVRVLGQTRWLNSVNYYDFNYREIQSIGENILGGIVRSTSRYDFTGKTEKDQYFNSISALTVQNEYGYDYVGRLLTIKQSINGAMPITLISNQYNEIGQAVEKNVHSTDGSTFLQSTDYRYNIRGWLTQVNNSSLTAESGDNNPDLFGMEIQYNSAPVAVGGAFTTKKIYGGNISSIKWKTNNKKESPVERIYGFEYDVLERLSRAYNASNSGGVWSGESGMFDEKINGYDKNGNIRGIIRSGKVQGVKTTIDDLTFGYLLSGKEGNRLITIDDASGNPLGFKGAQASVTEEYQYDGGGNVNFDHNKSISRIDYNHLNLPTVVQFTRPNSTVDRIEFTYDGLGNKISKVVKVNGTQVWKTDYVGGAQYDNNKLSFFATPDGRVVVNGTSFEYEYFLKDHQQNTRVVYAPLKETINYRATMETVLGAAEEDPAKEGFRNIATRRINPGDPALNYTKSSDKVQNPDRSAKCNANAGQAMGPGKKVRVLNGDAVYMEVYAKYTQATGSNALITAAILGAAVTSGFGIVNGGETAKLWSGMNANAAVAAGSVPAGTVQPKAYLVYLFFDDTDNFQRAGAVGISLSAYNAFEKLSLSFTADKNGTLYTYVASESNLSVANVYFDEFYIVHQKTNATLQVIQASDFYPFGLSFNEYQADRLVLAKPGEYEPALRNRYLFQGQELQRDLDLGWYQYKWRMHDPAIGRFGAVDPLAEKYCYNSTFAFSENKVTSHVEIEGLESIETTFFTAATVDAAIRPSGFGAHTLGFAQGLQNSVVGLYNTISSPIVTAKGIGNLALAGLAGNPINAMQMDLELGTNSHATMMGVTGGITNGVNNLIHGDGLQRGEVVGEIAGAFLGGKGLSAGLGTLRGAFASTVSIGEMNTLFHATTKAEYAENIVVNGINAAFLKPTNRFGSAFYTSSDVSTTFAEVAYHGSKVASTVQFSLGLGGKFLNATSPALGLGVMYTPKFLGGVARGLGYDGVIYNSLRSPGTNLAMFKNFNLLQDAKLIP